MQIRAVLGTGAVGDGGMPEWGPCTVSDRRRLLPACTLLVSATGSARIGCLVGGGVSVPYLPPSVLPWHSISLGGHSRGFVPLGQLCHSGGVDDLPRLYSPVHSLAVPPGVFRHSGGLVPPLSVSHSGGITVRVFPPAGNP